MDKPSDPACEAKKRGRPPRGTEETRRQEMLAAAESLFLEQGFGAVSMEAVAKKAGISKKTIYAFVPTKEALFEEVMKAHIDSSDRPVLQATVSDLAGMETALAEYLNRLAQFILVPFAVSLFRLTIAEVDRFPEIARAFYRQGALRSIHQLEDWLRLQVEKGLVDLENPYEAAMFLNSMVILEPLRAAALGVQPLPMADAMETRAKMVARIFLRGCGRK